MTTISQSDLPLYQEPASQIRNPDFVLLPTFYIEQCSDSSKSYVQLRFLFCSPQASSIALHVLQPKLICGRVPCRPCTSLLFIQTVHAVIHDLISRVAAFLLLQYFLPRKGRHHYIKHGLQEFHRNLCGELQQIQQLHTDFQNLRKSSEHRISTVKHTQLYSLRNTLSRKLVWFSSQPLQIFPIFGP